MRKEIIYGTEVNVCNGCDNLKFKNGTCKIEKNGRSSNEHDLNSITTASGYKNYLPHDKCQGENYTSTDNR